MLPKENRLEREKFADILKTGRRVRQDSLTLVYKQSQKTLKIGIVVGKKVAKKAVDRNKIKRRIRNILIQAVIPSTKAQIEGVIMAYPGTNEKDFKGVKKDILEIFSKIN